MTQTIGQIYEFSQFRLLPDERLFLAADGEPIQLPPKVFDTLLVLVENGGHLVEKDALLKKVWADTFVEEATLARNISILRKTFSAKSEGQQFIETVPKRGYRFIEPVRLISTEADLSSPASDKENSVAENAEKPLTKESRGFLFWSLIIFVIGILFTVVWFWKAPRPLSGLNPVRSIAVLPLKNSPDDPANDYLSDGITESLINTLSQSGDLKVISRGSVFRFKGKDADPQEIGRQLGVSTVLEGSVKRIGEQVNVVVRLVSTEDGSILWTGETHERPTGELQFLQDDIARQLSANLRVKLTGEDRLSKSQPKNTESYQYYLKGLYFWNKRTPQDLQKAIEHFEKARELEPDYALAYAGLANGYVLLAEYRVMPAEEGFSKARTAATHALELDNSLAEAHAALAYILAFYDWNWTGAEEEFKLAIRHNPNYATAYQWYSEYLVVIGRFDEARATIEKAQELDPLSMIIAADVASYFYLTRQYDETIAQAKKALELDPNFPWLHMFLWAAYNQKGMEKEAVSAYINVPKGYGEITEAETEKWKKAYEEGGAKAFWEKRLAHISDPSTKWNYLAWDRAFCYLRLNDKEKAIEWLQKAYKERDRWIITIKCDPQYDVLRDDARFQELVRKIGLSAG